ncbi:uncharacterized protein [Rutidosis leptorrhynchoides]|uniref:uncharacterized protein n=1 Tax=Rutidosis leptorrhynchoides TaxID=125765 RepID=UPI003A9925D2
MDAVDTLSRSETSFYNCSVGSDIKPSGIIPNDPKMREFMMGRFLPAAKAIASNVSQHTSKKNVIKEKQQEFKKLMDDKKGQLRYGPNFLEDVSHDNEDDDDDSDSDYHDQNHSSKFCGLIPRFCSVNPVHGMCMRTKLTTKFTTSTASSSTVSSITGSDNEPARTGMYERRSWNGVLKSKSTETINLEGSKLYNRLQGRAVSVSFSEPIRSSFPEENPKNSKKKALSFKELLADKNTKETDEEDEDLMVEKTLYVDTVQTVKSPSQSNFDKWSESDDESKDGMKRKTCTKSCKDYEDFDLFDEKFGDLGLKGYECKGFELPAPPSDSWLCRTLPLKSSKNTPCQWDPIISPSSNTVASDQNADVDIRSPSPQGPLDSIPEN